MSESIDEWMQGLDENSSNDVAAKEIKYFKKAVIKSIDKFLLYIKLETKRKGTGRRMSKKKILKRKISQKNISKR